MQGLIKTSLTALAAPPSVQNATNNDAYSAAQPEESPCHGIRALVGAVLNELMCMREAL
jgi:hypothetical protein